MTGTQKTVTVSASIDTLAFQTTSFSHSSHDNRSTLAKSSAKLYIAKVSSSLNYLSVSSPCSPCISATTNFACTLPRHFLISRRRHTGLNG